MAKQKKPRINTAIEDGLVDKIVLYRNKFWLMRLDVLPFLVLYVASTSLIVIPKVFESMAGSWVDLKLLGLILFPIVLVAHLFVFLYAQSSLSFRCLIGKTMYTSKDLDAKTQIYVLVKAHKNAGSDRIVLLQKNDALLAAVTASSLKTPSSSSAASVASVDRQVVGNLEREVLGVSYALNAFTFTFQEVTYFFDVAKNAFSRLDYPTNVSVQSCLGWEGHSAHGSVVFALQRWGLNDFNIPVPHFLDLYMEHLVAPFFVFQVLCLFLWSLDDYWYYSLFTLMMLLLFEGVMCNQRQNNVQIMKNMRRPPHMLYVFRNKTWVETRSDTLVPGDIFSITADKPVSPDEKARGRRDKSSDWNFDGKVVPCDALLVRGSCVVNEAMLTGESVPKIKECVLENLDALQSLSHGQREGEREGEERDITKNELWGRHLLLGGTLVQQYSNADDDDRESEIERERARKAGKRAMQHIPSAPDGGCVGVALRTGFGTTQGELMRKILFSTESSHGATSSETVAFIAVLVLCAALAAAAVLYDGVFDETRNKFRLVLHCVIIITSVVPPELPMELSLAVTTSLAALSRQMIFCTEPFRIAYAGRLDVVCFDKTGTLTKDEMILKGVAAARDVLLFTGQALDVDDIPSLVERERERDNREGGKARHHTALSHNTVAELLVSAEHTTDLVRCVMGTCHDLAQRVSPSPSATANSDTDPATDLNVLGDPLELAAFGASGFKFLVSSESLSRHTAPSHSNVSSHHFVLPQRHLVAHVTQKYPFSSELKRMSVVAHLSAVPPPSSSSGVAPHSALPYNAVSQPAHTTKKSSGTSSSSSAVPPTESASYVFCKGAPEVVQALLRECPPHYAPVYQAHMQAGKRVLALAYKLLSPSPSLSHTHSLPRDKAEKDLEFAGFLVFDSDLKADSKGVVRELRAAAHRVVMITGDSVFTAANVSRRLAIIDNARVTLVLHPVTVTCAPGDNEVHTEDYTEVCTLDGVCTKSYIKVCAQGDAGESQAALRESVVKTELVWRRLDSAVADHEAHERQRDDLAFSLSEIESLTEQHALCVTGAALDTLLSLSANTLDSTPSPNTPAHNAVIQSLCPHVTVFARVSPTQKELVVRALNGSGLYTLMCGDGTNDVGALKAAHVGVSIVNNPRLENIVEDTVQRNALNTPQGTLNTPQGTTTTTHKAGKKSGKNKTNTSKDRVARALLELQANEADPSIVKLGDASIASPFTAKRTSIDSVLTVIRQGRCTLVTTIQVYKVLALNCLASAFMMSVMYMLGLKHGDTQMTVSGLLLAAMFFFLSQAKPIASISDTCPPASVFARAVILSIVGQFAVHLACMQCVMALCRKHSHHDDVSLSPDGKFSPNLVNSSMFLLSTQMLVNNFWVNYRGPPYMEALSSNIYFYRVLQGVYLVILVIVGGQFEPINDLLQLVQFPSQEFQVQFLAILAANAGLTFFIERVCRKFE